VSKLLTLIKFFIKGVHINNIGKFSIGSCSGVGSYSRIQFSSEGSSLCHQTISIGNYAGVGRNCELHVWENNHIVIKDYSTLNDGCKLLGDIIIEKYCLLSSNVFASSGNHYAFTDPVRLIKDQDKTALNTPKGKVEHSQPMRIEEDCWIGYGVFIRQGVSIGRGAIIGANSVVLNDVEPYSVQGGVPAKEIKKRFIFNPPDFISHATDEHLPYFYRGFEHKGEILEVSRKQSCIYADPEAVAILSHYDSFSSIQISGTKLIPGEIQLTVSYHDKYKWNLRIDTSNFDFNLKIESAIALNARDRVFNSLSTQMHKYSIICLTILNPSSKSHFGINAIKINK
jgi:acetyltransferase-like isoleucine patch superfamily enzyme